MEINFDENRLPTNSVVHELVTYLKKNQSHLQLGEAQLYYDFPILKDVEDQVIIAKFLLLSPKHGILLINPLDIASTASATQELQQADADLEHLFSLVYSRLIRNKTLRKSKTELAFPINNLIFAPNLAEKPSIFPDAKIAFSDSQLHSRLTECQSVEVSNDTYNELLATIDGAKGIIRPKPRNVENLDPLSKGVLANQIESEIASFDRQQKQGAIPVLEGLQRIRGLAGSGKTVVLAMKAALTHLRDPEATILYTFYTKSLYQHIQRLITRFYRQFDDKDPDWSRVKILHGWGGYRGEGVYFNACKMHHIDPVNLNVARLHNNRNPFDYACQQLLSSTKIGPMYDYIFIDEGQDFPASFIQLCLQLAEKHRVVFAYDDLQTIFQVSAPEIKDIVGTDENGNLRVPLTQDVVLYKCYRNPREILVVAHAVGFGIYGQHCVQMLENKAQWMDIGYQVDQGDFVEGSLTVIKRPEDNSLTTISRNQEPGEIVQAYSYSYGNWEKEIATTVQQIEYNLKEGLRPEDILVIVIDDQNAGMYFQRLTEELEKINIESNNIYADSYGIRDFHKEGHVTLSSVHKAKGNEAFMVYVLGIGALSSTYVGVRQRNMLFTAMTRAKGWVRVSGTGGVAEVLKGEIDQAMQNFPFLKFNYPSQEKLKIIKRDLAEKDLRKQRAEHKLAEVLEEFTPEEIARFSQQWSIQKGNKSCL